MHYPRASAYDQRARNVSYDWRNDIIRNRHPQGVDQTFVCEVIIVNPIKQISGRNHSLVHQETRAAA